jgi:hypothetical protein
MRRRKIMLRKTRQTPGTNTVRLPSQEVPRVSGLQRQEAGWWVSGAGERRGLSD